MNKVFNTVWSESHGMWVVTSELVRKGGQRSRQVNKTVLAGLIAGLLMPQHPVLATSYDNQILQNGSLVLDDGDTASNTTINDGGHMHLNSGSIATSTTINSGGYQEVDGSVNDTTINFEGRQDIYDGGSATDTTILYGSQFIWGSANNTSLDAGFQTIMGGGSAIRTTINGPGVQEIEVGGSATDTTIHNGSQIIRGSATSTTINSGGTQNVQAGGSANDTTINDGYQNINNGGSATSTTINRSGTQSVQAGGSANITIINSGGTQNVRGSATDTTIINASGFEWGDPNNSTQNVYDGGSATRTTINGGYQSINNGGNATHTTINDKGLQYIFSGGSANVTTINGGYQNINTGGNANDTTLNSGYQNLYGGSATDTTINGGKQHISNGGVATSTIINDGGTQEVNLNGSATDTTINKGGYQLIYNNATDTTINGGTQHISDVGVATSTIINDGGTQQVQGNATDTTINNGGVQDVYSMAIVDRTTVNSGGLLKVNGFGSATQVNQNAGGAVVTNTNALMDGTNQNGNFSIAGGSASNMLLENGGYLTVLGGHQASDTYVGNLGTLEVDHRGVLMGTTTITNEGVLRGNEVTNEGNLYFLNNTAASFNGALTGTGTLTQEGGSTHFSGLLTQDGGIFLHGNGAMTMDNLQATANVTAQPGTTLSLENGTVLTGRITGDSTGAGDVAVKGSSVWLLAGDSSVGALTLDNGRIDFRESPVLQAFQPASLTAASLSGSGTFRMNTDIASHTGDLLNVMGDASGNFVLDIKNTGREPVSADKSLQVVHTGGGDAGFTLMGGKVDAGTWEYYLNKNNTDWYLTADQPGTDKPDTPDQPGTDKPDTPDQPGTDKPNTPDQPARRTTKSTDAVLGMATAPAYVFNSELQNLRFRHGDATQNTVLPGGVWGRYMGSDNRITGAAGSGYKLYQNGFETGGDTVFDLGDSNLRVGAFVSYSANDIKHDRGGNSKIASKGGGLYATWFDNDGYYVDGVIKFNHFNNELRTWMSDGNVVKGDYSQNGFGGSLEAGKTFSLNEGLWAQPYVRTTAFRSDAKDINLNNGMKARIGATKSLQGEAGVDLGINLDVAGTNVKPYLTAAVSHEFSDNNKVRINNRYDFTNDISGTTGKFGAGVNAQLTPNAGVWAEANYQKGRNNESPVTGSVGFRINF